MEDRSSRRMRTLVTQMAPVEACPLIRSHARWYPWWSGARAPIRDRIHWCKTASTGSSKSSCNARPDHTLGHGGVSSEVRNESFSTELVGFGCQFTSVSPW